MKTRILSGLLAVTALIWGISVISSRSPFLSHSSPEPALAHKKELYQCPMHPSITSDHPGICPICHMDLQKVDEEASGKDPSPDTMGAAPSAPTEDGIMGRSGFSLSQEKQQLIGVTSAEINKRLLFSEIRATGRVAFDPELYTAIEEYRQALMSKSSMGDNPYEGLNEQANELVGSAKTKLRLMGLTDGQIRELAQSKSNSMSLLLPGGRVWIYAEVFEYEVAGVKIGQELEAQAPFLPGKVFKGKISSISPVLNAPTRTVRVRAQVPDPERTLRPDTFLNVRIKLDLGEAISVPEDAILHSGDRSFVFVVKEKGKFYPRQVVLGRKAGEYYEVLSGLEAGETVVTAANFLIDSESRLKSALKNMGSAPHSGEMHHD